jgi:ABC transport system ATP-binding/permease protein
VPPIRNLVNLKDVAKAYGSRSVLHGVTLGVSAGERIGIVGGNGQGKSTLLRLIAGIEEPDAGALTVTGGVGAALLGQGDDLDSGRTIRQELVGERPDHEWAGDATFRSVLDGLLGGVSLARFPDGMETRIAPLSGGERRRIALARLLLDGPELLLLDEPTNHLDVEGIDWLARHLAARRGAMLVVTHDRWFLDAVATATWEVVDGGVNQFEGGYAAYVLARAERDAQSAARDERRRNLLRKELAWLRRGPPARTSKPKFRIDAANALIADEPEPRDRAELLRFAGARLGDKVLDAVGVSVSFGAVPLLRDVTWRLGPGDRVALVGVNGSGKTTLIKVLTGELSPTSGVVETGATVKLAHLSQEMQDLPGDQRVLESLEAVRGSAVLSDGQEVTAGALCDRFGFRGDKARTLVRDLSGGERRRLQLMRLLMDGPNVLLLDEPTNDLDIDTLTALEDLLDSWPGTLVVVSHDRYFVERVCEDVHAITATGGRRHLPGGIDQYVAERRTVAEPAAPPARSARGTDHRAERKEAARLERALDKLAAREAELHAAMAAAASDHSRLSALQAELTGLAAEREALEDAWLEAAEGL